MSSPDPLETVRPRPRDEVAAMAVAVQANVVTLKVAWSRRARTAPEAHEIRTPPPGAVRRFREVLIDRSALLEYSDAELALRTRQVWGEFTVLCWVLGHDDPHRPPDYASATPDAAMRCAGHLHDKIGRVAGGLWRLRHEQRWRFDPAAAADPAFAQDHQVALSTPLRVFGRAIGLCSNEELLLAACEHAGMLAALRWTLDSRRGWEAPGIMDVPAAV